MGNYEVYSFKHVQHFENGAFITHEEHLGLHNLKNLKSCFFFPPILSLVCPSLPPSFLPYFPTVTIQSLLETKKKLLFIIKRSWFSKFSLALLELKMNPAMLKSLSQAAEAGRGSFSFTDSLKTAVKDFQQVRVICWTGQDPSSCLEQSCACDDSRAEKKSSSSDKLGLVTSPSCSEGSSMSYLM